MMVNTTVGYHDILHVTSANKDQEVEQIIKARLEICKTCSVLLEELLLAYSILGQFVLNDLVHLANNLYLFIY